MAESDNIEDELRALEEENPSSASKNTTDETVQSSINEKKARAEKFGTEVVLTEEEKLQQRKSRFMDQEEAEKIKKRKEKFGDSALEAKLNSELDTTPAKKKKTQESNLSVEERLNAPLSDFSKPKRSGRGGKAGRGGSSRGGKKASSGRGGRGGGRGGGNSRGKSSGITPDSLMVTKSNDRRPKGDERPAKRRR